MSQPFFDAVAEVTARVEQAPHVLLCLDYDGTLAQFAAAPPNAKLSPQMDRALLALGEHETASVAVMSGRSRNDMLALIGVPGFIYAGNHGLEISGPGYVFVEPNAAAKVDALERLAGELQSTLQHVEGVLVEYKGLTISVHFRQVKPEQLEEVRRRVHAVLAAASHPFVLTSGEKVFEIRPRVEWHKGNAIAWIRQRLDRPDVLILFVGDDLGDEEAFKSLSDAITVKVGGTGETSARYRLEGPAEVRKLLEWLDDLLGKRSSTELRQPPPSLQRRLDGVAVAFPNGLVNHPSPFIVSQQKS